MNGGGEAPARAPVPSPPSDRNRLRLARGGAPADAADEPAGDGVAGEGFAADADAAAWSGATPSGGSPSPSKIEPSPADRRARRWYSGPCLRGSAYSFGLIVQYVPLEVPYHEPPLQPGSNGSSSAGS